MRILSRSLIATAFALLVAGQANAIAVQFSQTGGSYNGVLAVASDTLELSIDVVFAAGDIGTSIILMDAGITAQGGVDALGVGSTETAVYFPPGPIGGVMTPIVTGADIKQVSPITATNPAGVTAQFDGWELQALAGVPVVAAGTISLGTIVVHLDGTSGVISIGGFQNNFGTVFTSLGGAPGDIIPTAGTFAIIGSSVPEPTTAGLMALGVIGLAFSGRRR